jgi:hypothetical protein
MATETVKYIRTVRSSGHLPSDVEALIGAYNQLVNRFEALLAKLDADAGVDDTDYAATINGSGANALQALAAVQ